MSDVPKRETPWLAESAAKRAAATAKKLRNALDEIELDIQRNENIYPFNGGKVNQAEVCRRAGVLKAILQGSAHKTTTKVEVDKRVAEINKGLITGRRNVRKAVTDRVDNWKAEHEKLLTSYILDMHRLTLAENRINELTEENAALREQLTKTGSNVHAMGSKVKK